jgi:hypothetical protein
MRVWAQLRGPRGGISCGAAFHISSDPFDAEDLAKVRQQAARGFEFSFTDPSSGDRVNRATLADVLAAAKIKS